MLKIDSLEERMTTNEISLDAMRPESSSCPYGPAYRSVPDSWLRLVQRREKLMREQKWMGYHALCCRDLPPYDGWGSNADSKDLCKFCGCFGDANRGVPDAPCAAAPEKISSISTALKVPLANIFLMDLFRGSGGGGSTDEAAGVELALVR